MSEASSTMSAIASKESSMMARMLQMHDRRKRQLLKRMSLESQGSGLMFLVSIINILVEEMEQASKHRTSMHRHRSGMLSSP